MWDGLSKPVKDVVWWGLLLAFCVISEQLLFNSLLYRFGVLKKSLMKVVSKPSGHCVGRSVLSHYLWTYVSCGGPLRY